LSFLITRWFNATSHKDISLLYFLLGWAGGIIGISLSFIIRSELKKPQKKIRGHLYNTILTAHALIIIFFMVIPTLMGGYGNYFVPLILGAPDLIYPRLNLLSLWLLPAGIYLLTLRMSVEGGSGTRWVFYPPLASEGHYGASVDLRIFSLHVAGVSRLVGRFNFITTIIKGKGSLNLESLVLFLWTLIITTFLLILSLPVLAAGITIMLFDRNLNTCFFEARGGGNALLYQHLFWFFGHPEVYILVLPAFGIVSHSTVIITGKRDVESYLGIVYSIIRIGLIGCVVWAHHIYVTGIDADSRAYFTAATIVIAIPTGIKVFTWLLTSSDRKLKLNSSLSWVIGFIFIFTFGGVTGVILSNAILDVNAHDTYFVVGHFHYVLSIGAVFGIFTGISVYWPMVSKLLYNKNMIQSFFNLFFLGVNITFLPIHFIGIQGCPRKYKSLADKYSIWSSVSTFGATIRTISIWWFITIFNDTIVSFRLVINILTLRRGMEWLVEHTGHTFTTGVVFRRTA